MRSLVELAKIAELIDQGQESQAKKEAPESPWMIGQAYFIQTVTHYWTGRLVKATDQELVIEEAAWIASTGRFHQAFTDGFDEIEPVPDPVIIGRGSIVAAHPWGLVLPREVK